MSDVRSAKRKRDDSSDDSDRDHSDRKGKEKHRHHHHRHHRDKHDSDDDRHSHRHKKKEKKKKHKDKKHKKSKSKNSSLLDMAKDFVEQEIKKTSKDPSTKTTKVAPTPISIDDYYNKNTEFSSWLRNSKGKFFEDLETEEAKALFASFVEKWNRGSLPEMYYVENKNSDINARTKHKWNFTKNLDSNELEMARDKILADTNNSWPPKGNDRFASTEFRQASSANSIPVKHMSQADRQLEYESRKTREKVERRREREKEEMILDELAPKATGRDALIEQKRARAIERRERESSPTYKDEDIMGGGDDFQTMLRRQREAKERRERPRQAANMDRFAERLAKEEEKMNMFKSMVAEGGGRITIKPRDPPPPSTFE